MLDFKDAKKGHFRFFELGTYELKSHQSSILDCSPMIGNELWGLKTKQYFFLQFQSENIPNLGIFRQKHSFFGL